MKLPSLSFLGLALTLTLAPAGLAQEQQLFDDLSKRGPLESRPDRKALEHLVERLKPRVERLAGRKFKEPIDVRVSTVQDAARSLNRDFLLQYERLYAEYSKRRRAFLASLGANAIAAGLLGKYGMLDRKLHLLPQRITPILKLFDFDEELARGLFTLIVAHEMVHALQDQHVDLAARARKLRDSVDVATFVAAIEGQAEFVSHRLAKELGLEAEGAAFTKMVRLETQRSLVSGNATELSGREHRLLNEFGYVHARDHLLALSDRAALERSWSYLEHPLPSTGIYYGVEEERPDDARLAKSLEGAAKLLGRGRWAVARSRIGPQALHSEFSEMSLAELREHLKTWRGGQSLIATLPPPLMRVRLGLLSFRDAEAAAAFVRTTQTWWKREAHLFADNPTAFNDALPARDKAEDDGFRLRGCAEVSGLDVPDGSQGYVVDVETGRNQGFGSSIRGRVLWLAHGRFVLHLFEQNHELDAERRNALIRELLSRAATPAKR